MSAGDATVKAVVGWGFSVVEAMISDGGRAARMRMCCDAEIYLCISWQLFIAK